MTERAAFAYAQVRLQSHNSRRPTQATWQHLNASKSLGHYLESARQTALNPWVTRLTANSDVHQIETALRRDWRDHVGKVAAWLPRDWRPAVLWTAHLADLATAAHLARHRDGGQKGRMATSDLALEHAWLAEPHALSRWLERFCKLWPDGAGVHRKELDRLIAALRPILGSEQPANTIDGVEKRERFAARLERLVHQSSQRPVAVFAHLVMMAIDLERLRAHLVHRCLFPETLDNR